MSILVNKDTKVIVQGITGSAGLFHATQCREYGTQVVGGVTPGQLGPMSLASFPCIYFFTLIMSRVGMPSVIQITSSMPASIASIIESMEKGAGTNISDVLAPVFSTALDTVSNTGNPSTSVPPFPGVTPPTT